MPNLYVVLYREIEDVDSTDNVSISVFSSFESLRKNSQVYNKNVDALIFITDNQNYMKLDGLENIEFDTSEMILAALFDEPITFDSIINDEYSQLEEQIKVLTAENNLLKEQLAECQGNN